MNQRTRRRAGIVWLLIIVVGTIAAGEGWAFALFGFTVATLILLGLERLVKMILDKQG